MKKYLVLTMALALSAPVAFAGSYEFKCSLYIIAANDTINILNINRDEASLNQSVSWEISDPNINIYGETIEYIAANNSKLNVAIEEVSQIVVLNGSVGKREKVVDVKSVKAAVELNGVKSSYQGTCTETTISTCGGSCD